MTLACPKLYDYGYNCIFFVTEWQRHTVTKNSGFIDKILLLSLVGHVPMDSRI